MIIAHSKNKRRELSVPDIVLQAWNTVRWPRHRRWSNGGVTLREARVDGSADRA